MLASKSIQKSNSLRLARNVNCHRYNVCLSKAARNNELSLGCFYCKNKNSNEYSLTRDDVCGLLRLVLHAWCGIDKRQTNVVSLWELIDNRVQM